MLGTLHCVGRARTPVSRIGSTVAVLAVFLMSSGCSRDDALEHLKKEVPVDTIEIVHARFPCRSPDLHFFGYRFGVSLQHKEFGYGDVCWNFSTRQWTWQILPDSSLSVSTRGSDLDSDNERADGSTRSRAIVSDVPDQFAFAVLRAAVRFGAAAAVFGAEGGSKTLPLNT